ncbi:hypothetical protein [Brytella acorum]|uniref:Uncharacterized protein n=1 Tax=Brytella acorum TaxID=2959299 RepID=A0AA35UTQ6_9PROT|nr:hypothetical protein [Brytella acorum]CAI9119559.1 hypothetical protein LMG32879_000376 [Brytella acorum]
MAIDEPDPIDIGWVVEELRLVANENVQGMPLNVLLRRKETPEFEAAWLLVQWWRKLVEIADRVPQAAEMLALVRGEITEEEWPDDDRSLPELLKHIE